MRLLFSILILLLTTQTLSAQYTSDARKAKFFLSITEKYSPDAHEILLAEGAESFVQWADGTTREDMLESMGTVVHESCHGYQSEMSGGWQKNGYFLGNGVFIVVDRGKVFDSNKMIHGLPASYQSKITRFDPYLTGSYLLISRQFGVYGLLDEMASYYQGAKVDVELLEYYESICSEDDFSCWAEGYLSGPSSSMCALHEFRLFIGWYLQYARKYEKDVYKDMMENRRLRVAFTLVDAQFEALEDEYYAIRESRIEKMQEAGLEVMLEEEDGEEYLWAYKDGSGRGIGTFGPYNRWINSLITDPIEQELDRFRMEGVTMENYEAYL